MWAIVEVQAHKPGDAPECKGGDECSHGTKDQTYGLLFHDPKNVIDESASFADQLRQTIENLIRDIPEVAAGEWFTIRIVP